MPLLVETLLVEILTYIVSLTQSLLENELEYKTKLYTLSHITIKEISLPFLLVSKA